MNINDVIEYFYSIDSSRNNNIEQEEIEAAKPSIFSSILEVGMDLAAYEQRFLETYRDKIDFQDLNSELNLPYRMDLSSFPQQQIWEPITEIVSKEFIDAGENRFYIKTAEGVPISPELDFNSEDGAYMLKHLSFDSETFKKTPLQNLPKDFNPDEIIENGKNPGLNIKSMHKMGYTGKGITVACIDAPILTNHKGIKSSLVGYEVMDNTLLQQDKAYFHGQAVADILAGDETGAAPNSNLVYFAGTDTKDDRLQALRRIVEINNASDEKNKIKVLSISWDFDENDEGYKEYKLLLKELTNQGVFIATAGFSMVDDSLGGVVLETGILEKKEQNRDPDDFSNYTGRSGFGINPAQTILLPSGDRTVASAMDENKYRHDSKASTSWSVPALAGIYACALQCAEENGVELTPEKFRDWALETGVLVNDKNGNLGGYAINAEALCKKIMENGAENHKFGL